MEKKQFEDKMRSFEVFHGTKVPPGAWIVIRLDGRSFSKLTETHFEKPFDSKFHNLMVQTAGKVLEEMEGIYAYTQSDEISVLLPRNSDFFNREVEKLVSISAAVASAYFSLAFGRPAIFDSRVVTICLDEDVADYFAWREDDASRNCLSSWAYWLLRKDGQSGTAATRTLIRKSSTHKNDLLFEKGVDFSELPLWQKRGTGMHYVTYEKVGFNPKTGQTVKAVRERLEVISELPMKQKYRDFILKLLVENRPH